MVACLYIFYQDDKGLFALELLARAILKIFETSSPFSYSCSQSNPLAYSSPIFFLEDTIMESIFLLLSQAMCIYSSGF